MIPIQPPFFLNINPIRYETGDKVDLWAFASLSNQGNRINRDFELMSAHSLTTTTLALVLCSVLFN